MLTLAGIDITNFVAADGLSIAYEGRGQVSNPPVPVVTITFGWGALDLDFDVELIEQLLTAARAKAGQP